MCLRTSHNRLHAIDACKHQACTEHLCEGLKLVIFQRKMEGGGWGVGGWAGPKDDCLLVSLQLDPFCDTTSTIFTPNLTVEDR